MPSRTMPAGLAASAHAALADALSQIGAELRGPIDGGPGAIALLDGQVWPIEIVAVGVLDQLRAEQLARHRPEGRTTVVVADLVAQAARPALEAAGVGWLDRRGHLRITARGLWIDRDIAAVPRIRSEMMRQQSIRGAAAIGVAASHLIDNERVWGVRGLARDLHLSPAAVSKARRTLEAAGMLTPGPDARRALFWALADGWRPSWIDLSSEPGASADLFAGGTLAAAALGAPIVATANYPLEMYVADAALFERVRAVSGGRGERAEPPARLALAPTPLVCDPRITTGQTVRGWTIAHPLFVGLDLASDPARGAEALVGWDPPGWPCAW